MPFAFVFYTVITSSVSATKDFEGMLDIVYCGYRKKCNSNLQSQVLKSTHRSYLTYCFQFIYFIFWVFFYLTKGYMY